MKAFRLFRCIPALMIATAYSGQTSPSVAGEKIRFVSFHVPPFSIRGGERPGFVGEIVQEISRRLSIPMTVNYATSARESVKLAKKHPNTLIFPLARTPKREKHFIWIVKVRDIALIFASAPGKPRVNTIEKARSATAIGVRAGFAANDLKKRGFKNLVVVRTPEENARSLASGRITAWYGPAAEILYTWRITKQSGKIGRGMTTKMVRSFIAASKSSPQINVKRWQTTFAAMKSESLVRRIVRSYLGE